MLVEVIDVVHVTSDEEARSLLAGRPPILAARHERPEALDARSAATLKDGRFVSKVVWMTRAPTPIRRNENENEEVVSVRSPT